MTYDKKGYPIRPGDVLKVFHFVGMRNKKHYMYKIAWNYTLEDGRIYLMASHLGEDSLNGVSVSNSYKLPEGLLEDYEIVQGYANKDDELSYLDRPRLVLD